MRRVVLLFLLLLVPVVGPVRDARCDDEEAAYKKRRREALLRRARERVRPNDPSFGDIDERAATLRENRDAWLKIDAERVARAGELIGTGKGDGLIRESARFYRWLVAPWADGMAFPLRNAGDERVVGVFKGDVAAAEADVLVDKRIDVPRRRDDTIDVDDIEMLRQAENVGVVEPPAEPRPVSELRRPLVRKDELTSRLSQRWLDVRVRQRDLNLEAWAQEGPSRGFEDDERVRQKDERLQRVRKYIASWRARRDDIVAALDDMAAIELAIARASGRRTVRIEELDAKQAAGATPEVAKQLEEARFEQWVERLELRLLYITARRAIERLRLLDTLLEVLRAEEEQAANSLKAFESERLRIYREAQLERIESDAYEMRSDLSEAETAVSRVAQAARDTWAARVSALKACLEVNALVRKAVLLRQGMESGLNPAAAATPVDAKASVLDRLAATTPATIYGTRALAYAETGEVREDIPAGLVAHLHDVADERVVALEGIVTKISAAGSIPGAFDEAFQSATAALTEFQTTAAASAASLDGRHRAAARRWSESLAADRDAFTTTWAAIEAARTQAGLKLRDLRRLRRDLTDLGPRSFQVSMDRKLRLSELSRAWDDVRDVAGRSERWITMRDDEANAWTFARTHWLKLLVCVAILLGGLWGARTLRGALGRWLDRQAQDVATLRNGLSLDAEAAVEREQAEQAAAEVEAIAQDALEKAAGRETDPAKQALASADVEPDDDGEVPR